MRPKSIFIAIVLLSLSLTVSARDIDGYVRGELSGDAVRGARVSVEGTDNYAFTNNFGYFTLSVQNWTGKLTVIATGYEAYEMKIDSSTGDHLEILLPEDDYIVPEEVGDENRIPRSLTNPISGYTELSMDIQNDLIVVGSETDPVKSLQMMPGVEFGREGMGEMFVRGGGSRQNLFLLNGIPVYGDNHAFGFLSIYNQNEVNNISLFRGAYPARYGGRLSSVVDITSSYGNKDESSGYTYISPLTLGFGINGPLGGGERTSFALSGRRSYIDIVLLPLVNDNGFTAHFYDLQLNWETKISDKTTLQFHSMFARDNYTLPIAFEDSSGIENWYLGWHYTNLVVGSKLNHAFTKHHFGSFSVGYSFYKPEERLDIRRGNPDPGEAAEYDISFNTGNFDIITEANMEYHKDDDHFIRYGGQITAHGFNTGRYSELSRNPVGETLNNVALGDQKPSYGIESALYFEDEINVTPNFIVNAGLRTVLYAYKSFLSPHLEPRIMMAYRWNKSSTLKLSYMRVNQFLHSLNNDGASISMNRWIPSTEANPPKLSNQINLAWVKHVSRSTEFHIEGYYKTMSNLYLEKNARSVNGWIEYSSSLYHGEGQVYGMELYLQKMMGNFTGYTSYALSNAQRNFVDINGEENFPFNFDRRHTFKFGGRLMINSDYLFAFNVVIGSGLPYTLPNSIYRDINGEIILGYEKINNYRAEWYRRLDIGITKFEPSWSGGGQKLNLSLYNILGTKNTTNVIFERDQESSLLKYDAFKRTVFVFIPGIRYEVMF